MSERHAAYTLSEHEKRILAALPSDGGLLTRDVAKKVHPMFGTTNHMHSAAVRSWLLHLEHLGLVRKLDDEKPVCWRLAPPKENPNVEGADIQHP
ncbi:hypothetical protein [Achromobacter ruhlandii]|uniref:Uncharacterized protein n=1 Tax=Achromobacter ruhlandii TaxID=72557 RepID=A0A6S7ERK8_9BURK|nr:hypothetical protein [Achromobacter ruhlandii]CAB3919907.1 hypothetical protein LMG3328_05301 [Achromobacter ruhlandii]